MRSFPVVFREPNESRSRKPRFIVAIRYETASVYFTSHDDIPNVPGIVIENVLKEPAAISQKLVPDEGRSEIGAFSFSLVDLDASATETLRDHLANNFFGPRAKEVRFYIGYEGLDFADFQRLTTQTIQSDSFDAGVYKFKCKDITREQKKEIFKPYATTLQQDVSSTATIVPVANTLHFLMVAHDSAYSDAPNQTVGYFRLEDEIIRYTGKTASPPTFTGCTRGVLNTAAKAHAINASTAADRQPKIEEYIYLEGPGPALALAVLTGDLYGTANSLPSHWALQFDPAYVRTADFVNIGLDLWDTTDPTKALVLRFEGLKAQDGKRFFERELLLLLGCYSPVYSDGTVGMRRMAAVVPDAAPSVVLTEKVISELSALEHDGDSLHNQFRVRWAWDPVQDAFIRESRMIDGDSIETHGTAPLMTYEFRGLHGERHTDTTIAQRLDAIRDRYNEPPLSLSVTVPGSLNGLEVGDIVGIRVPEDILRDYTSVPGEFNRSFEIQQITYNAHSGAVKLQLFGSTARPNAQPPTGHTNSPLPDAFYNAQGAALTTIVGVTSGNTAAGTFTLPGNANMNAAGAVYYYLGDLTIASGTTLNISDNVKLLVRGFLTINGRVDGVGAGKNGIADPGTLPPEKNDFTGTPGFIGNSRGWDGVRFKNDDKSIAQTWPVSVTHSVHNADGAANSAWPVIELKVVGNTLLGIPADLRGTGGPPGGRVTEYYSANAIRILGGTGGDGGAGLCIVCRGFSFGGSGAIDLDGENTTSPSSPWATNGNPGGLVYAGAGGPGGPGGFLLLLDGNQLFFPVVAGYSGRAGTITQLGTPIEEAGVKYTVSRGAPSPASGYADPTAVGLSGFNYSYAAHRIQYIGDPTAAEADVDSVPAPTGFFVSVGASGNLASWIPPPPADYSVVEVWSSLDDDRGNALLAGEVKGSMLMHNIPLGGRRFYWIRARRNVLGGRPFYSTWEPLSATAGVPSNVATPSETPDTTSDFIATPKPLGIRFTWALPVAGRMTGLVQLYEHNLSTPFSSATKVFEGYALSYLLPKFDTVTRYYWIVLMRSGETSLTEPVGAGLPGHALPAVTPPTPPPGAPPPPPPPVVISATASPTFIYKQCPASGSTSITSIGVHVTGGGGTPGYTFAWTWAAGGVGVTINSPSSSTTTFSGTNVRDGTFKSGTARCTVTDTAGHKGRVDVSVRLYWPEVTHPGGGFVP